MFCISTLYNFTGYPSYRRQIAKSLIINFCVEFKFQCEISSSHENYARTTSFFFNITKLNFLYSPGIKKKKSPSYTVKFHVFYYNTYQVIMSVINYFFAFFGAKKRCKNSSSYTLKLKFLYYPHLASYYA